MKNKVFYLLLLCPLFFACLGNEDEIDHVLIEKKLLEEANNYKKLRLLNCREEVMNDAEMYVDSIMLHEINFNIGGNLAFPGRPMKPQYIGRISLNDTTKPRPFLDFSEPAVAKDDKNSDTIK